MYVDAFVQTNCAYMDILTGWVKYSMYITISSCTSSTCPVKLPSVVFLGTNKTCFPSIVQWSGCVRLPLSCPLSLSFPVLPHVTKGTVVHIYV